MDFRPLNSEESRRLRTALSLNANRNQAIIMDKKDTTFVGTGEVTDDEVINAVRSVPMHYAR